MTTLNLQVAAGADDGYWETGAATTFNTSANFISFGTRSFGAGARRNAWMRFLNVAIPQGATIVSAELVFTGQSGESTAVELLIDGNDEDDAANPIDQAGAEAKARTTASVQWDFSTTWTDLSEFASPDIAAVIQEIVNRGGWASGQALMLFVRDDLGTDSDQRRSSYSFNGGAAQAAKLNITYADAAASAPPFLLHRPPLRIWTQRRQ